MSTATQIKIGPHDHGRRMSLDAFVDADFEETGLYELARGVVDVTEVPGPNHGRIVRRLAWMFMSWDHGHPGVIQYGAGGGECRIRLPGMQSDRHPDQAIYLSPQPKGKRIWTRWVPSIVVEVVSAGGEDRDYVEKREEYLRVGVLEYWILDPSTRSMKVLQREGDVWREATHSETSTYRTPLLPGLEANVGELLGPLDEPASD